MRLEIAGLRGLAEINQGDPLADLIRDQALRENASLGETTVVVIAQKIVSKAEGALVDLRTIQPSALARDWAAQWGKDARLIELILRQSRRIVKMDRGILITETHHGLVCANAGVDRSNVPGGEFATILPADPDASACRIRVALGCGAVIISDTFGRPWREGLVNVAIGVSGLAALEDCRGSRDREGRRLDGTVIAVADELAAAAGLLMPKSDGCPVVLINGLHVAPGEGSRDLIRPWDRDLFR